MSPRSGSSAKQPRGIGIVLGLFFSFVIFAFILMCLISGLIMGRWRELLLDSRDFAELLIPFTVAFFVLAATWRKGGWIRVKEKYGLKEDEIALRHRHYHEAVDKAEWLGKKAAGPGQKILSQPRRSSSPSATKQPPWGSGPAGRNCGDSSGTCAPGSLRTRLWPSDWTRSTQSRGKEAARRPQVGHKDSPHNQ